MISVFLGISCAFLMCQDNVSSLLPVFEEFLKNAPQDASYDSVRQSVVILMGSLAKHLDKNDPKVKPIVAKLITALSTPSQQVKAYFGSFSTHSTCTTPIFTTSSCCGMSSFTRSRSLLPAVCLLWSPPSKRMLQGLLKTCFSCCLRATNTQRGRVQRTG